LHDLSRVIGIELDLETDYTTIAGLCMELAARIPKTGAVLTGPSGVQIEILDATPNQVRLVRITAPALAGAQPVVAD
jgi:putative hemolysin